MPRSPTCVMLEDLLQVVDRAAGPPSRRHAADPGLLGEPRHHRGRQRDQGLGGAQQSARGSRALSGDAQRRPAGRDLVNCAGQWARQFGALAGVTVPLYPAEHFYIVTDRIEGVHPMLPVMRDPDGYIYCKEEVDGLLMGGLEPMAKPWTVGPIPSTFQFQFQLLDEDWDQFEPLMRNAIHRTPCLETAKVKMLLNGPESFTPDGNFILGETPELRGCFVCAGFNSADIANSGGANTNDPGPPTAPCA
jgi:glycine/D-amino acid oxidase-like deaminating enzyme